MKVRFKDLLPTQVRSAPKGENEVNDLISLEECTRNGAISFEGFAKITFHKLISQKKEKKS